MIGLGTPEDYNARVRQIPAAGATAISFLPCNSDFRGVDCDEVDPLPLGTCGTVSNTVDDMDVALDGVPLGETSTAMNDPSPFTLLAFTLGVAKRRGIAWEQVSGTSNQSDYISHFIANHMFYRLSLPGSRRVLTDHVAFCLERLPNWNPISVVGQHMQQAGATPAETVGFTFSTALQYSEDCAARGIDIDVLLRRFTFFFDISISFFEEIARFRAARRIWARLARERLGAKNPNSWRFKFHGQTSGVDLTGQQPLNNIARVTTEATAGILSGLQSMHTDAYDEAVATIGESALRYHQKIERGEEKGVGVNCCQSNDEKGAHKPTERPDLECMKAHVARFNAFKESRNRSTVDRALASLARSAHDDRDNVFAQVVEATGAGVTHGEIVGCLRKELGFGRPRIVA